MPSIVTYESKMSESIKSKSKINTKHNFERDQSFFYGLNRKQTKTNKEETESNSGNNSKNTKLNN